MTISTLAFAYAFNAVAQSVEFSPEFANGTGYFDGAVKHDFGLEDGEQVKFIDPHGRRVIVTATLFGNCVAFERFATKDNAEYVTVVSNVPSALREWIDGGSMTEESFSRIVGTPGNNNIGQMVTAMVRSVELHTRARAKRAAIATEQAAE